MVAARGLVVVQHAAADAGGASRVVRDAAAGPGADKARHGGGAAVVVAALGVFWVRMLLLTVSVFGPKRSLP